MAAELVEEIRIAPDREAGEERGQRREQRGFGGRLRSVRIAGESGGFRERLRLKALRSILPELSRGICGSSSIRLGTM